MTLNLTLEIAAVAGEYSYVFLSLWTSLKDGISDRIEEQPSRNVKPLDNESAAFT